LIVTVDARGNVLWAKRFGDESSYQWLKSVAWLDNGDIVVAGEFTVSIDLGGGALWAAGDPTDLDVFLARFTSAGDHVTSMRFGDVADDYVNDLVVDPAGGIVVSGGYSGAPDFGGGALPTGDNHGFLLKLDAAQNHVWSFPLGRSGTLVDLDTQGNIVLAGTLLGVVDLGGGSIGADTMWSMLLARFDAAGQHLTSRAIPYGPDLYGGPAEVKVLPSGEAWIAGWFEPSIDLGAGALPAAGGPDGFVAKLDANLLPTYQLRFGDGSQQMGMGLAIDAQQRPVVSGKFEGTIDLCGGNSLAAEAIPDGFLLQIDRNRGP
jgi:hypothetical protein